MIKRLYYIILLYDVNIKYWFWCKKSWLDSLKVSEYGIKSITKKGTTEKGW